MFKILSLKVKITILGIQNRYIIHLNALELVKEYYGDLENATVQEGVSNKEILSDGWLDLIYAASIEAAKAIAIRVACLKAKDRGKHLSVSLIGALTNDTIGNGDHINSRGQFQSAERRWEKMLVKGRSDVASEMASLCYGEIVG
ncbi:hypothetical protein Goari_002518 [Gossypium aridum]|uniref:Uncharacterized protein n=3 Tax=Gossypium TaxID=3633 RepID=A0A7J8Y8K0_GOSAI|nr:hypothetical protein [Gossypium aridum]